jgi:hypothetical protein
MTTTAPSVETQNGATSHNRPVIPDQLAGGDTRAISAFSSESAFIVSQRMALALSASSLMPKAFQGRENIPNVMIAMELASRIGASVFMVAQNLDIIHGRPGWRSQFLIATVNASKRFTPLRFRFQGKAGTDDWGCRAYAKDVSDGEECQGALIDIRMAKAEGWSTKPGSKWVTMPEQMLMYRSAAFWTRVYCPELALGIATSEEAIDTDGYEVVDGPTVAVVGASLQDLEAKITGETAPAASDPQADPPSVPAAATAKVTKTGTVSIPKRTDGGCELCGKPVQPSSMGVATSNGGVRHHYKSGCEAAQEPTANVKLAHDDDGVVSDNRDEGP